MSEIPRLHLLIISDGSRCRLANFKLGIPLPGSGKPVFDETGHEIRDRRKGSSALVQRVSVDQGVTGRTIYPAQDCGVIAGSERSQDG